jgi:hypothetical protein
MSYGTIKVDTITFTDNSVDKSVSLSGLIQNPTFTGNITVTGTISGDVIRGGTTVSGATVTGTTANFVSGVFTTQISGVTVTGTTASFTSGVFTNISGTTATITSGIIASGTAAAPSLAILADLDTGLFSPGANELAVATNGTGRLFVDASGNVGVNTSSPSTYGRFAVVDSQNGYVSSTFTNTSNGSGAVNRIQIGNDSSNGAGQLVVYGSQHSTLPNIFDINNANNAALRFLTNNTERLRITAAGLLGVGTSAPGAPLEVAGASSANISVFRTNNATAANNAGGGFYGISSATAGSRLAQFWLDADGANFSGGDYFYISKSGNSGIVEIIQQSNAAMEFHTNGTRAVTIDSAQRVGIGTASPAYLLDIKAAATPTIRIQETTNGPEGRFLASASDVQIGTFGGSPLSFYTNSTEKARLDTSGRLLIGTSTSTNNMRLNEKLAVVSVGGISGASFTTYQSSTADQPSIIDLQRSRGSSDGLLTVVQSGDTIGSIIFRGSDGSAFQNAARIDAYVDGTPGANDMPGRLVFSTTADGGSSPTERMRIDSSGRVGIGTSGPDTNLTVSGVNASTTNSVSNIDVYTTTAYAQDVGGSIGLGGYYNGSTNISFANIHGKKENGSINNAAGYLAISTRNNITGTGERMRIDSSGNVGIGTTSASTILHVASTAPYIRIQDTDSSTGVTAQGGFEMYDNDGDRLFYLANESSSSSDVSLFNIAGGALKFGTSGSERGQFDSSGRLLVGTSSSPSLTDGQYSKLHVIGNSNSASGDGFINIGRGLLASSGLAGGTSLGNLQFTDSAGAVHAVINGQTDGTTGTNDYPGRLTFAVTADGASGPTEAMRITNAKSFRFCMESYSSGPSSTNYGWSLEQNTPAPFINHAVDGTSLSSLYVMINDNGVVGTIKTTGSSTQFNTSSDYRLKENITTIANSINRLQQLKPCQFNFIANPAEIIDGFIAHEVQDVVPAAISGEKDAVNEDGSINPQGIDQSKLVPLLTAALQEAIGEIESLKARVAALEAS